MAAVSDFEGFVSDPPQENEPIITAMTVDIKKNFDLRHITHSKPGAWKFAMNGLHCQVGITEFCNNYYSLTQNICGAYSALVIVINQR